MQMCNKHWEQLKQTIDNNGLSKLISKDVDEATESTIKTIQGNATIEDYDPLMTAYFEICSQAISILGISVLIDEKTCPICTPLEVINDHLKNCINKDCFVHNNLKYVNSWIEAAVNVQLNYARDNKLVPPLQ